MTPITEHMANEVKKAPISFEDWTEEDAVRLAEEENITLTSEHWSLVFFLRANCEAFGTTPTARQILKAMTEDVKELGGRKYLYSLFPRGPVVQCTKIAGIPLPAHSLDLSFGSVL
jgi:tRNA 2-thiouridine synthesizing protein E